MGFLIVGLGNVGERYEDTRHNVGFLVLDALAQAQGLSFSVERLGMVLHTKIRGKKVTLLKPSTYMNLSGRAVNYWMQREGVKMEELLIVVDDLALPLGRIRMRMRGSDGGHNGLKSIEESLESSNYSRIRVGIGSGKEFEGGSSFVLGNWNEQERERVGRVVKRCSEAVNSFILQGPQRTMNLFNSKEREENPEESHNSNKNEIDE
ncbi:MAG: aminoacyl-tRNA hydrolase [Bacteroidales bacterium]